MSAEIEVSVIDDDSREAEIIVKRGDDVEVMAVAELSYLDDNNDIVEPVRPLTYCILAIDSDKFEHDLDEMTPRQIEDLTAYEATAIHAAFDEYHGDYDSALSLLQGGYTVWRDQDDVIENFLEDYSLPSFIRHALDNETSKDHLWRTAREGRTLNQRPDGTIVEFWK